MIPPLLQDAYESLRSCQLCPRACRVDRVGSLGRGGGKGFCRQDGELKVAYVGPHRGEEPPITGTRGSGTVFVTGCSLRCCYCQNHQISHEGLGLRTSPDELAEKIQEMCKIERVHNVNFVSPDHFYPQVLHVIWLLRSNGMSIPVVINCSGYQSVEMVRMGKDFVDIYLTDFKYAETDLARRLSACPDYPEVALAAVDEMLRQKGYLRTSGTNPPLATKGVLVRHLILPGHMDNSCTALTMLRVEFGRGLPLSLMSQYFPVRPQKEKSLNRTLRQDEFDRVLKHAIDLGFENLFVQFPDQAEPGLHERPKFVPDFTAKQPFE